MNKSTHEEHLFQPLQTINKQFKIAVTFLSAYSGIFNVTTSNNKFFFTKSITDDNHFTQTTISPGANEIESLDSEIKGIVLMKVIIPKRIIHSKSNQILPRWVVSLKKPIQNQQSHSNPMIA